MFSTTARTLRTWWSDFSDDILGADLLPSATVDPVQGGIEHHLIHPHRQPLAPRRARRPGTVPERPAFCLSPVHPAHPRAVRRVDAVPR
jgi:hypothetical protein